MHYGTEVSQHATLQQAADAAIARHSHFYPAAAGWLLRAAANRYAAIQPYADPVSGEGEWYTTSPELELFAFPVLRWTPCGATILPIWGHRTRTWVRLDDPSKQWASRTAHEAIAQLAFRRNRQQYILERQLNRAKAEERLALEALRATKDIQPLETGQ